MGGSLKYVRAVVVVERVVVVSIVVVVVVVVVVVWVTNGVVVEVGQGYL